MRGVDSCSVRFIGCVQDVKQIKKDCSLLPTYRIDSINLTHAHDVTTFK